MTGREIKKTLKSGGKVYGTAIESLANPWQYKWYLDMGIDFAFVDNEHNPWDRNITAFACSLFRRAGIPSIVRIPKPDPYLAANAMDGGAQGVVIPYVENPDDLAGVAGVVSHMPLKGKALDRLMQTGDAVSRETENYLAKRNENNLIVAMIESREGIARLDEILGVPGVDAVLIGPHDLSVSVGVPEQYDHPLFDEAADTILKKCLDRKIGFGAHLNTFELHEKWIQRGANFILFASDTYAASTHISDNIRRLRKV